MSREPVGGLDARPRIASLVPSITELVFALGLGRNLVARTGFCIHPWPAVGDVPKVGGTKDVNLEKLRRLRPSHAIVNVDENRRETVQALRGFIPEVIVTHPQGPGDNVALIGQLAAAFGGSPVVRLRAEGLVAELQRELDALQAEPRPPVRTLYLIWRDPWMTVARDTYISRMLALIGRRTWPPVDGGPSGAARYPVVDPADPQTFDALQQIEEVLLSSEPYRFDESHVEEVRVLCPNARVRLVDGELLSWYGPRAAAGLRYLRRLADAGMPAQNPRPWI